MKEFPLWLTNNCYLSLLMGNLFLLFHAPAMELIFVTQSNPEPKKSENSISLWRFKCSISSPGNYTTALLGRRLHLLCMCHEKVDHSPHNSQ